MNVFEGGRKVEMGAKEEKDAQSINLAQVQIAVWAVVVQSSSPCLMTFNCFPLPNGHSGFFMLVDAACLLPFCSQECVRHPGER